MALWNSHTILRGTQVFYIVAVLLVSASIAAHYWRDAPSGRNPDTTLRRTAVAASICFTVVSTVLATLWYIRSDEISGDLGKLDDAYTALINKVRADCVGINLHADPLLVSEIRSLLRISSQGIRYVALGVYLVILFGIMQTVGLSLAGAWFRDKSFVMTSLVVFILVVFVALGIAILTTAALAYEANEIETSNEMIIRFAKSDLPCKNGIRFDGQTIDVQSEDTSCDDGSTATPGCSYADSILAYYLSHPGYNTEHSYPINVSEPLAHQSDTGDASLVDYARCATGFHGSGVTLPAVLCPLQERFRAYQAFSMATMTALTQAMAFSVMIGGLGMTFILEVLISRRYNRYKSAPTDPGMYELQTFLETSGFDSTFIPDHVG